MASRALKVDPKIDPKVANLDPQAVVPELGQPGVQSLDRDETAARAYELWCERGCPTGSPEVDWFRAEEELRMRHGITRAA